MAIGFFKKELILIFILPLFKKTDCHERFNYKTLRLSWNCQPIVNRLSCIPCGLSSLGASFSRFLIQIRPFFAFLLSNPTMSPHGADAPHDRPMIAPWSPHDRPMIAPWSPVHLQVATVKNAKKICTCKNFSIFRKSRKMCKKWWKMSIFSSFFLNKNMFSKVVF